MPATHDSREHSQSTHELEDSDDDDIHQDGPSGKPGRKKNPNSQAARRDQNRIAQREFRLRKQQRIRDLEAKVEILSGGKDEALSEMRNIVKDLMQENQTLRGLLRSLSAFIGEGAGGLLPKLGWNMSDFNSFINKSETDTAWEGYQRRKKDGEGTGNVVSGSHKRPAEDTTSGQTKRTRVTSDTSRSPDKGFTAMLQTDSLYPSSTSPSNTYAPYAGMLRDNGPSPLFYQSPGQNTSSPSYNHPTPPDMNYQYIPPLNVPQNHSQSLPVASGSQQQQSQAAATPPSTRTTSSQQQPQEAEDDDDDDPNKNEAYKLIHYHLDNYKRNTSYCLPSSLRPTLIQRTVPHESVIDRILHPELRDRMILMRGRFDLVDCLLDYRGSITIHGDDVLNHSNWEISEKWLIKYGFLVDQPLLDGTNRWRAERHEPKLLLAEIAPPDTAP